VCSGRDVRARASALVRMGPPPLMVPCVLFLLDSFPSSENARSRGCVRIRRRRRCADTRDGRIPPRRVPIRAIQAAEMPRARPRVLLLLLAPPRFGWIFHFSRQPASSSRNNVFILATLWVYS